MKRDSRKKTIAIVERPTIEDEIRKRAHELFEARGKEGGHELEDWLRAEHEIKAHQGGDVAA